MSDAEHRRGVELWRRFRQTYNELKGIAYEIEGKSGRIRRGGRKKRMEIDNTFNDNSNPPRRFYLERIKDETGVSRTGRVLEGVLWQNGEVTVQWRPPHSTMGFYHSLKEFEIIHVDCHPSCNVIRWLEGGQE